MSNIKPYILRFLFNENYLSINEDLFISYRLDNDVIIHTPALDENFSWVERCGFDPDGNNLQSLETYRTDETCTDEVRKSPIFEALNIPIKHNQQLQEIDRELSKIEPLKSRQRKLINSSKFPLRALFNFFNREDAQVIRMQPWVKPFVFINALLNILIIFLLNAPSITTKKFQLLAFNWLNSSKLKKHERLTQKKASITETQQNDIKEGIARCKKAQQKQPEQNPATPEQEEINLATEIKPTVSNTLRIGKNETGLFGSYLPAVQTIRQQPPTTKLSLQKE